MTADRYRFGDYLFDARRGALCGPGGDVPLRPKSFALLHHLLANAGRLVGKDELMAQIWPGVIVTDDSLTRCISDIRSAIDDRSQEVVKTVARRGYLFAAPVAADTAEPLSGPPGVRISAEPVHVPPAPGRWRVWRGGRRAAALAAAIGVGLIAVVGAIGIEWHAGSKVPVREPPPPRLSLVVLPFASAGQGAATHDVLPAAVTEALTISLSRLYGTTVISPASAQTFEGRPVDVREVGRALRVRYVLQGSVLGAGDTARIAARLLDAADGRTLWSDQFDAPRGELLATQERIVDRLASALGVELVGAEEPNPLHLPESRPDAEELGLQCEARIARLLGPDRLCEQALALDRRNVRALAALALYHADRAERRQGPDPALDQTRSRAWVDRALEVAPGYYAVQCAHAVVLTGEHRVREAVESAERCRGLNPSHAQAYRILAALHFFLADPERTLAYTERAMILSPRDPQMAGFQLFRGWAYFMMGRDADAIVWLHRAAAARPDSATVLAPLISVLALNGRDDEAHALLARYRSLPSAGALTVSRWTGQPDDNPGFVAFGERFKAGLRRAGMPES